MMEEGAHDEYFERVVASSSNCDEISSPPPPTGDNSGLLGRNHSSSHDLIRFARGALRGLAAQAPHPGGGGEGAPGAGDPPAGHARHHLFRGVRKCERSSRSLAG
jgi:hypothetical protein